MECVGIIAPCLVNLVDWIFITKDIILNVILADFLLISSINEIWEQVSLLDCPG